MTKPPYPGFSPSYKVVNKLGGMSRQVWVLEICTHDSLNQVCMSKLEDDLLMLIESKFPDIKISKLISSDQFDTNLRHAMRVD